MKITLEPAQLTEVEVIIRGNISDPEVAELLKLLGSEEECRRIGEAACAFARQYGFTNVKRQLEEIYFG